MILQELIRNIVVYRGLIHPLLQLIKENMFTLWRSSYVLPSQRLTSSSSKRQDTHEAELISPNKVVEMQVRAIHSVAGTHTIPIQKSYNAESPGFNNPQEYLSTAIHSRDALVVLSLGRVQECTNESSKTALDTQTICLNVAKEIMYGYSGSTTGFTIAKYMFYLSHETHEKREYLGEFSLTHEEIQLTSMKERG